MALQCCISFCFSAKWISYTYTRVPSFLAFLPIYVTTQHWVEFPLLYSICYCVIHWLSVLYVIVYMSVPISQFILPSFCLGIHKFVLYFCFANKFISIIFFIPHISDFDTICVSNLLHSEWRSLILSMCLQMALFNSFLWLSNIPLYMCTTSSLSIPLLMDI